MNKGTRNILFPNENKNFVIVSKAAKEKMKEPAYQRDTDEWECSLDVVTACSKVPTNAKVTLTVEVQHLIDLLMKKFEHSEWLAYLIGEGTIVTGLFIPKQRATSGSVHVDPETPMPTEPIVGVIHSHHSMGHFFSHTDDSYINMNHNVSIVVSTSGMKAQIRVKTPCGALKVIEADVETKIPIDIDTEAFLKMVDERVNTNPVSYMGCLGAIVPRRFVSDDNDLEDWRSRFGI